MNTQLVKALSLYIDGRAINVPQKPTAFFKERDLVRYKKGMEVRFGPTVPGKELTWIPFVDASGQESLMCDRCLLDWISRDDCESLIGMEINIDEIHAVSDLPTVGRSEEDNGDWSRALETVGYEKLQLLHWGGIATLGKETWIKRNFRYVATRGDSSICDWSYDGSGDYGDDIGWRPVLRVLTGEEIHPEKHLEPDRLCLTESEQEKALKILNKTRDSLSFFQQLVQEDYVTLENVETHLGLFESYFSELASMMHYDSILAKESEKRHRFAKRTVEENRRLRQALGSKDASRHVEVSAALVHYSDVFDAWYESLGFHYASQTNISTHGFCFEMTCETDYEISRSLSGAKELFEKMKSQNIPLFEKNSTEWDIYFDQFHGEILDTDGNRERIRRLFQEYFPNSQIIGFESRRNDFQTFSLRTKVYIPFGDIVELEKRYF